MDIRAKLYFYKHNLKNEKQRILSLINYRDKNCILYTLCASCGVFLRLQISHKYIKVHSILINDINLKDIRLSEKCLSFTDTSFTTMHLYTNTKPNLSNVVIFILIE